MKPRQAWLLLHEQRGSDVIERVAVIIPSRKVTNKVVDDLVREFHLRKYGRLWPNKVWWTTPPGVDELALSTPVADYRLVRVPVYG